ncbi:L-rhamnose mutarotase [Pseudoruegeria sp. SK021]|uniref:L-rhamnose mutarotase n=1 Tax=Pseudoruegeria sp. SK021 TaxID=1933035 RepID=UPI001F0A66BA|nr:L-rhamnose mutarotase [Pseudoruegeria sp. SK021]
MRYGMIIGLHADKIDEYKALHAKVWPDVLAAISRNGVRNFTIFLREPENLLFGVFDYDGDDYAEAARRIDADPVTQQWYKVTEPCQKPLPSRSDGEWWSFMENVFHLD